jgi:predicted metalloendopeptidase
MNQKAEVIDPIMERKRVKYWGEQVGVTFNKKIIPREEKMKMQEKVDRFKEVLGTHSYGPNRV